MSASPDSRGSRWGHVAFENGPESASVVVAIKSLLRRETWEARSSLRAAAEELGWAAVAHRLDVAGRALCIDRLVEGDRSTLLAELADTGLASDADRFLIEAWCDGGGVAVAIDLMNERLDTDSDDDRCWHALGLVTWLVDSAGYPPEVIV